MSVSDDDLASRLRALPRVDAVVEHLGPWPGAAAAVRAELELVRQSLRRGAPLPDLDELARRARARLTHAGYPRVLNATGVILHTGLGRAPLARSAAMALAEAEHYAVVEVDPSDGERRHREHALVRDLTEATGAEAATVVNNNAGALLLILHAIAEGRPVIVSRGQLIEIGGGFRLPDLLALAGAPLIEVGTTNRTYAKDFGEQLSWETGLMLVMHTSNFRIEGFAHEPGLAELHELGSTHAVPLVADIGSGLLLPPDPAMGLVDEPDAMTALAQGADLVCFSGDKLLGGPQAGIIVGRADLVARCRRHPLFRALRPDRLALTALHATLAVHREARHEVPVLAALLRSPAERRERAAALAARLRAALPPGVVVEVVDSEASAGSGSAPARPLPSAAVRLVVTGLPADELACRLRTGTPSVFPKLWRGQVQLDVAALHPGDDELLPAAVAQACAMPGPG